MHQKTLEAPAHPASIAHKRARLIHRGHDFPSAISIELTSKCNLTCKMCPLTLGTSSSSQAVSFMDLAVWRRLLDDIDGRVEKVILTGFGEPMLHPHLLDMLSDLEERSIPFGLTTNGVHIKPGIEEMLPGLTGLRHLNVSIDSFDADIYRHIRKGKITKCLATIARLVRACGPQTLFSVSAIIMKTTLPSLRVAPQQLAEIGVTNLVLQSLFDQNPSGLDENLADPAEDAAHISAIRQAAEQHGVTLHFEDPERLDLELNDPPEARKRYFDDSRDHATGRLCGLPWDTLHVDANSAVFPCCRTSAVNQCNTGRIDGQSVFDVWQGSAYDAFRRSFASPQAMHDVCATCTAVPMGLPPRAFFSGTVLDDLEVSDSGMLCVAVRNTGVEAWRADRQPTIGISRPKDRISTLHDHRWISGNRVCSMREDRVEPGDIAHFDMPVSVPTDEGMTEHFELVIDGQLWIPGTGFSIEWMGSRAVAMTAQAFTSTTTRPLT